MVDDSRGFASSDGRQIAMLFLLSSISLQYAGVCLAFGILVGRVSSPSITEHRSNSWVCNNAPDTNSA